jgi:hypothetical protein
VRVCVCDCSRSALNFDPRSSHSVITTLLVAPWIQLTFKNVPIPGIHIVVIVIISVVTGNLLQIHSCLGIRQPRRHSHDSKLICGTLVSISCHPNHTRPRTVPSRRRCALKFFRSFQHARPVRILFSTAHAQLVLLRNERTHLQRLVARTLRVCSLTGNWIKMWCLESRKSIFTVCMLMTIPELCTLQYEWRGKRQREGVREREERDRGRQIDRQTERQRD